MKRSLGLLLILCVALLPMTVFGQAVEQKPAEAPVPPAAKAPDAKPAEQPKPAEAPADDPNAPLDFSILDEPAKNMVPGKVRNVQVDPAINALRGKIYSRQDPVQIDKLLKEYKVKLIDPKASAVDKHKALIVMCALGCNSLTTLYDALREVKDELSTRVIVNAIGLLAEKAQNFMVPYDRFVIKDNEETYFPDIFMVYQYNENRELREEAYWSLNKLSMGTRPFYYGWGMQPGAGGLEKSAVRIKDLNEKYSKLDDKAAKEILDENLTLVKSIKDEEREEGLIHLVALGERSKEAAVALLTSDNFRLRITSARILGSIGAQDCLDKIASLYHDDPNEEVRRAAATALKAFGEYSIGIFVNDLSSPDAKIREEAFTYVKSKYALAAGELEKLWEKGDEATKRNVETIVKEAVNNIVITKSRSRGMRNVMVWDPFRKDWPRRIGAIEIFGKRIEPAIDTLIEIVTNESEQQIPRCRAALLMTDLGGGDNVLRALLKLRDSEDPDLLKEAFTDIGQLRNPKAIKILTADLDKFPEYRFRILRALGDIGDPEALDTLFEYFKKGNDTEKNEVVGAVAKIHDEKSYKFLLEIVNDKKSAFRKNAISALSNEKAKEVSGEVIFKIYQDTADPNCKDAENALLKMKDSRLTPVYAKVILDAKGEKPCSEEIRKLWMLGDRRATAIFMDIIADPRKYDYVEAVRGLYIMNYLDFQFPIRANPPADINLLPAKQREAKMQEILKAQQLECLKKIVAWWEKNKQHNEYHIEGLK